MESGGEVDAGGVFRRGGRMDFDGNPEAELALMRIREGISNLFVTGEAGTGKTTLLRRVMTEARESGRVVSVVAPSAISALLASATTVHRFLNLKRGVVTGADLAKRWTNDFECAELSDKIGKLSLLIVDEISMVRADTFAAIDLTLRRFGPDSKRPFGGIQILCFGDFLQLPPVVAGSEERLHFDGSMLDEGGWTSPYAFDTDSWRAGDFKKITLRRNYRQEHSELAWRELLSRIRLGAFHDGDFDVINSLAATARSIPEVETRIYPRNKEAQAHNNRMLRRLPSCPIPFESQDSYYTPEGDVDPRGRSRHDDRRTPLPSKIMLACGARVMQRANDRNTGRVNGHLGILESFLLGGDGQYLGAKVRFDDGEVHPVGRYDWEEYRYRVPGKKGRIKWLWWNFNQIGLEPAWAMSIHKAQGQTVEGKLAVGRGCFEAGQFYVALSRVRRATDLVLLDRVTPAEVRVNSRCLEFMEAPDAWNARECLRVYRLEAELAEERRLRAEADVVRDAALMEQASLRAEIALAAGRIEKGIGMYRASEAERIALRSELGLAREREKYADELRVKLMERVAQLEGAVNRRATVGPSAQTAGCMGLVVVLLAGPAMIAAAAAWAR